jgi:hypothetical protein
LSGLLRYARNDGGEIAAFYRAAKRQSFSFSPKQKNLARVAFAGAKRHLAIIRKNLIAEFVGAACTASPLLKAPRTGFVGS